MFGKNRGGTTLKTENDERIQKIKDLTEEITSGIFKNANNLFFDTLGSIFDSVDSVVRIVNTECKVIYTSPKAKEMMKQYGENIDGDIYCYNGKSACENCSVKKSIDSRKVSIFECKYGDDRWMVICIPLIHNGISGVIQVMEKNIVWME